MLKLEFVMLIAVIILSAFYSLKARGQKKEKPQVIEVCGVTNSNEIKELPFHPENNLQQFVDSMAKLFNCKIIIKESPISTTLNARPVLRTLFGKRDNRRYVIRINNKEDFNGVKLADVPSEAKVGLWFHELMHIKDYQSKTVLGIVKRGLQYLSKKGKRIFEHEIDKMVIKNGYGEYLYHWSQYSMESSSASEEYKAFKSSIYLTPEQIMEEINQKQLLPVYNPAI